jgi:hypothetical protein
LLFHHGFNLTTNSTACIYPKKPKLDSRGIPSPLEKHACITGERLGQKIWSDRVYAGIRLKIDPRKE